MALAPRWWLPLAVGGSLFVFIPSLPGAMAQETAPAADKPAAEVPAKEGPAPDKPAAPIGTPAPSVTPEPDSAADPRGPRETDEEQRFVELVNQERVRRGLQPLRIEPLLITVARKHSAEMRDKNYFNHNSPTPGLRTPLDRYLKDAPGKPQYACVGENLFYCTIVDVERGHNAFMNSPTHRENILFGRFEKIGVGIVKNPRGEFWVTQMFVTNTDPTSPASRMASRH